MRTLTKVGALALVVFAPWGVAVSVLGSPLLCPPPVPTGFYSHHSEHHDADGHRELAADTPTVHEKTPAGEIVSAEEC